jgi:hypothetical protein
MIFNEDSLKQNKLDQQSLLAMPQTLIAGHKSTSSLEKRQRISSEDHEE